MAKANTHKTKHQPGPSSRAATLASIDRRTKAGRVLRTVEAELTSDIGGDPSTAQRLLIQSAATKACRLYLLSEKLLGGDEPGEDGHHALAWMNSMRLDLMALGLERRAKTVPTNPLSDHFSRPHAPFMEAAE